MSFKQDGRLFSLNTPLGKDVLLLKDITGEEGISGLYSFHLNLLSENHSISFKDIIGKNVTISIALADGKTRYFNGIVSEFSQSHAGESGKADILLSYYTATVVPWLWLLTRTTDSRIFQNLTLPEIVEKIFVEKKLKDFKLNLKDKHEKREYCVQYRETDFNFISRLLEDEGIYYFFQHEDGKHTLILADDPGEHHPCPEQGTARCRPHEGGVYDEDMIDTLLIRQEIRAGKYTLNDFNFEMPNTKLKTEVPSNQKLGPEEREYYDYPGGYGKKSDGDRLAKLRMQEEEARITTFHGTCNIRAFTSGYRFRLEDFYRDDMNNKEYVLTGIRHEGSQTYSTGDAKAEETYKNEFTCIPFDVPYRHPRLTPKPFVQGAQTAIVVGPSGEEIYPDKYGRVKVQFHWDREGKKNESSSCFVRVSQAWAGAGWGAMFIPRIGHEVIVDFLEGDPDRPIITGRVYHGTNNPPYSLPAEKTKSTIKSDSSPGGGGSNELRFEDKKGKEEVYLHGQKDWTIGIENDKNQTIGNNESTLVKSNRTIHVQAHFKETIDSGEDRTVQGGSKETISGGEIRNVSGGITETVDGGEIRTISGGQTETINGGQTENINGGETRTVNGGLKETINGALLQNVSGGMTINSPAGVTISAPAGFTVVAPGGTKTIDSMFTKIGGKDEDLFAIQTAILTMQTTICGMSNAMQGIKIDVTGLAFERCGIKSSNEPLTIQQASTKLKNGAIGMYMYGMTLIM
jgi:type VI secretion system secreted protein VgrG